MWQKIQFNFYPFRHCVEFILISTFFKRWKNIYNSFRDGKKLSIQKKVCHLFSLKIHQLKFFSFFRSNRQTFVWTNLKRVFQLLRRYAIQLWVEGQWKWACTHNEAVFIETTRNTCKHTDNWIVWTHWRGLSLLWNKIFVSSLSYRLLQSIHKWKLRRLQAQYWMSAYKGHG